MNKRNSLRVGEVVFLAAATLAAYWPALAGGYIWTDIANVTVWRHAGLWQNLTGIWASTEREQYFPLTYTTFLLEHLIWGNRPLISHLINVLLHITNVLLFMRVLRSLGIRGVWLAGALFALHPVHVESVAWIVERKNLLSLLFYLLSLLWYLRFIHQPRKGWYWGSLGFFALALLSKSSTVVLPAVIVLCLIYIRRTVTRRAIIQLLPFLMMSMGMAVVSLCYEHAKNPGMAAELHAGFAEHLVIAGRIVWFYIGKLCVPLHLSLVYEKWHVNLLTWIAFVPALGVVLLLGGLWQMRRRWGTGPILAVTYYLGCLFPLLGFFSFYYMRISYVADHFQYLPSLGLFALFAGAVSYGMQRYQGRFATLLSRGGVFAALAILWALTWNQCHLYKNDYTIFKDSLTKSPDSWTAHAMFARAAAARGELKSAIFHDHEAIRLRPNGAPAYIDLGRLQMRMGRRAEAESTFRAAIHADPRHPGGSLNLANLYAEQGRFEQAVEFYQRCLTLRPNQKRVHTKLAKVLKRLGRDAEAQKHFDLAAPKSSR